MAKFEFEKIDSFRSGILPDFLLGLRSRFTGLFGLILPQLAFVQYFGISEAHRESLNFSVCSE